MVRKSAWYLILCLVPLQLMADLEILDSLMPAPEPEQSWYRVPETSREVDTVVIHYASAAGWFNDDFQKQFKEQLLSIEGAYNLTPDTLDEYIYDWQLVKTIFEAYGVSAHYIITREGQIIRLVPEAWVAWHAGESQMPHPDGRKSVNTFSIGIELLSQHPDAAPEIADGSVPAYTEAQYTALLALLGSIQARWPIRYIVGHDEIAPKRKKDPGPLFDWSRVREADFMPLKK